MPSRRRSPRLALLAAPLLLCPAAAFAATATAVLRGHVPPQVGMSTQLAPVDPAENVDLSLFVNVDQALLDKTLAEIYAPSTGPRHYLAPGEFAARFGLAAKRRALKDFARASGLSVAADDDPNSLVVRVSGPAAAVQSAFGVQLNRYRAADGQVYRGHATDPVVPASLAPHLRAVLGLSNYRGAGKPHLAGARPVPSGIGAAAAPSAAAAAPAIYPGTGPGGGLSPSDIKTIYGLTSPLTGSGQTVALLELDGYAASDVTAYESQFGLPSMPLTFVSVDGQANLCGAAQNQACNSTTYNNGSGDGGMLEVTLDIDMMLALAPGASGMRVYTGPNTAQGIIDSYAKIAADDLAASVSTSWGLDEKDAGGATMAAEATAFQQMAAQGQTMFAAAGDAGAYDNAGASTPLIVVTDDPASQPYVTGVGGTTLSGTISGHSEVAWNEGCASPGTNCRANGSTGGGIANYVQGATTYWLLPGWQSGIAGTYSQTYRNVPDVALNADPNTFPYISYVAGGWWYVGGTSAAAPLWAAETALINQKRATNGYGTLGFANVPLYQLGASVAYATYFNDITSGTNGYYSAGTGYDNVTGWGSFKADALIAILGKPLAPASAVSPSATTNGISSITVTWSQILGATGYDVYDATNPASAVALAIQPPLVMTGLSPSATYGLLIYGENQGVEGPFASITPATLALAPGGAPSYSAFVTSATISWPACGAGNCSGYVAQVSTSVDFTTTISSSVLSPLQTSLTVGVSGTPLVANTGYFVRYAQLNPLGVPNDGPAATFATGSGLAAPISPGFDQITTSQIRFNWAQGSNPSGLTYYAQASTAANFSGALESIATLGFSATFTGLTPDTSYYCRVQAVGGGFLSAGPSATLAVPPLAAAAPFSGLSATGLAASWVNGGDQPDTLYEADVSPAADFSSAVVSSFTRNASAGFTGLAPNTVYYARVAAVSRAGVYTSYVALGSTATLVQAPTLPASPFSAQATNGFAFAFNTANPAGTRYLVRVATTAAFSALAASSNTASTTAVFSGLASDQFYYVSVAGLNQFGAPTAFTAAVGTATTAAAPVSFAAPASTRTTTTMGFSWAAGTLAPGTTYLAQISAASNFSSILASSQTLNPWAIFAGLAANTTYYGRVQALGLFPPTPAGPFAAAVAGATLPSPPAAAAPAFPLVSFTSVTVSWTPSAAEGYRAELSTAADFSGTLFSQTVGAAASSAPVSGLAFKTLYYARVAALSWEGLPSYLTVGSTTTLLPSLSSGAMTAGGLNLSVPSVYSQISAIQIAVPAGAFPTGTPVTAVVDLTTTLIGAQTNEAPGLTPMGSSVGLDLSAGGLQPSVPVRVTLAYDPAQIPAGQDERRLHLLRWDPTAAQWTLVPSQDDPVAHQLVAYVPHFSVYAPFFVTAGSDLSGVQVFPQPWEIGDASSQYWSSVLTFSGLPAGATVRLFTVLGEEVASGTASGGGVFTWDGANRYGKRAASGTYYAAFDAGGVHKVRRVVIIR